MRTIDSNHEPATLHSCPWRQWPCWFQGCQTWLLPLEIVIRQTMLSIRTNLIYLNQFQALMYDFEVSLYLTVRICLFFLVYFRFLVHLIIRKWSSQRFNTFVFFFASVGDVAIFHEFWHLFFFFRHCIIGSFGMEIKIITVALPVPEVVMSSRFSPGNTSQANREIGFLVSKETVVLRGWERSRPLSLKTDKPLFIHH